jgi:type VI secretion system secreted protein Hcp
MADAFLKIKEPDIKGESTDGAHNDWIEIDSFQHGMGQAVSPASSTGGRTASRVSMSEFTVSKPTDTASLVMQHHCCLGTHFKEVVVQLHEASGEKHKYYEITLSDVIISSLSTSSSGGKPHESVSFNYGKIKWEYTPLGHDGKTGTKVGPMGWDLETNKKL